MQFKFLLRLAVAVDHRIDRFKPTTTSRSVNMSEIEDPVDERLWSSWAAGYTAGGKICTTRWMRCPRRCDKRAFERGWLEGKTERAAITARDEPNQARLQSIRAAHETFKEADRQALQQQILIEKTAAKTADSTRDPRRGPDAPRIPIYPKKN
jgi:hypothetical protein